MPEPSDPTKRPRTPASSNPASNNGAGNKLSKLREKLHRSQPTLRSPLELPRSQSPLRSPLETLRSAEPRLPQARTSIPRKRLSERHDRPTLWQFLLGRSPKAKAAVPPPKPLEAEATRQRLRELTLNPEPPSKQPSAPLAPWQSNAGRTAQGTTRKSVLGRSQQSNLPQSSPPSRTKSNSALLTSTPPTSLNGARQSPTRANPSPTVRRYPRQPGTPTVLQTSIPTVLQDSDGAPQSGARPGWFGKGRTRSPGTTRRSTHWVNGQTELRDRPLRRRQPRSVMVVIYAVRMVVLSVGIGVLAGTCLSVLDPASRVPIAGTSQIPVKTASVTGVDNVAQGAPVPNSTSPTLAQELVMLKATVQTLISQSTAQSPQLSPGVFFLDLDTNAYVDVKGDVTVAAASTIKVPVLIAFFQDVDAGKIRLEEPLTLKKELIGGGSGEMQYQPVGTQYSALETATKMITISDNTATNLLIARLGGINALNQRFKSWGLTATIVNNLLPDLAGTNTTNPKELAVLLARLSQGDLVSIRSRDRILDIMRKTSNDSLLPRGLEDGATIAHKTGDIGTVVGDVGLIDLPNGKRYAAAVLVKCSFNDPIASDLIRQVSRVTYQFFSRPPAANPAPRAENETPRNPDGTPTDSTSTAFSSSER